MNAMVMRLVNGLAGIDESEIVEPVTEVQKGEEVLGEITDLDLKKFYTFQRREASAFGKKLEVAKTELQSQTAMESPVSAMSANLLVEHDYSEGVESLFWAAVKAGLTPRNCFETLMAGGVGIRKGWQIVALAPEPEPNMKVIMIDLGQFGIGGKPKKKE